MPLMRAAFGLLLMCFACAGCVKRSYTIESEPTGAEIFLDGELVGHTPYEAEFEFYVSRSMRIEMEGYNTESADLRLKPPPYEWFPFDFVSENVIPFTFRDRHVFVVELTPREPIPEEKKEKLIDDLQDRAQTLRKQAGGN